MKKVALAMALLAILALGLSAWAYAGARLELQVFGVRALQDEEYLAFFNRMRSLLPLGAVPGTVYTDQMEGGATDYVILEFTIRVQNHGPIPAQMLEAVVIPDMSQDILCYSPQVAQDQDVNLSIDAPAGKQVFLRCYLLSRRSAAAAVREIQVSYYVWGNPFILKVRHG